MIAAGKSVLVYGKWMDQRRRTLYLWPGRTMDNLTTDGNKVHFLCTRYTWHQKRFLMKSLLFGILCFCQHEV